MTARTAQTVTLTLLFVGTAASVYYAYYLRKQIKPKTSNRTVTVQQPNRDANLGGVQPYRKYFGFSGRSSAAGSGSASGLPTALSLDGTNIVQQGDGVTSSNRGDNSTNYRPSYPPVSAATLSNVAFNYLTPT